MKSLNTCYFPATSDRIQSGPARLPQRQLGGRSWAIPARRAPSVRGGSPVPEPGAVVVAAGHEAGVGGGVHDAAHDAVVAQRQQVPALGRARVPAAQADGPLVWQQHVILRVVEHSLSPVHLAPAQTST